MAFHHSDCEKYLPPSRKRRRGNIASSVCVNQDLVPKIVEDSGSCHGQRLYLMAFSSLAIVKRKKSSFFKETFTLFFFFLISLGIRCRKYIFLFMQKMKRKIMKRKNSTNHYALTVIDSLFCLNLY